MSWQSGYVSQKNWDEKKAEGFVGKLNCLYDNFPREGSVEHYIRSLEEHHGQGNVLRGDAMDDKGNPSEMPGKFCIYIRPRPSE